MLRDTLELTEEDVEVVEADAVGGVVEKAETGQDWSGWGRKRKIGRLKVSRSIPAKEVWNLDGAWLFARQIGLNCNLFFTVRPHAIDDLTPPERIEFWQWILNKIAQFARDHGFEYAYIWSRESDPGTGAREHLHVLTHIPPSLIARFGRVAEGWTKSRHWPKKVGEVDAKLDEIDIRPANYRVYWTAAGKRRSAITYITKNSPQAAYETDRSYRKGGPILGKRTGCSRNIDARARAVEEVKRDYLREFGVYRG